MSNVYFISDLHLDHPKMIATRKFSSIEDHNETIIDSILTTCSKKDTLWLLGDLFFSEEAFTKYAPLLTSNISNVHVILGNHDTDSYSPKNSALLYANTFKSVHSVCFKYGCILSHIPVHPLHFRKANLNIHGHTHEHPCEPVHSRLSDYYLNVSCEAAGYKPISLQEIRDHILV